MFTKNKIKLITIIINCFICINVSAHNLSSNVLISVGAIINSNNTASNPLFSSSIDGGETWAAGATINFPSGSFAQNLSCAGSGSNAFCIATLQNGLNTYSSPPLLAINNDMGNTWQSKTIDGAPNATFTPGISCTGTEHPFCVVTGGYMKQGNQYPYIIVSNDRGNFWEQKNSLGYSPLGYVSCSGDNENGVCIAAPGNSYPTYEPAFAVSTDSGKTWTNKVFTNSSENKFSFYNINCINNGNKTICTAVGNTETPEKTSPPLIAVTIDNGNTWDIKKINDLPSAGSFIKSSCAGSNGNMICAAAGNDSTENAAYPVPIIAVTNDGGNTWIKKSIKNITSTKGRLVDISCSGSGGNAICVAVGTEYSPGNNPLLIISNDGGNSWEIKNTPVPSAGNLESVKCTAQETNNFCVAVGAFYPPSSNAKPLIVVSTDGGNTWNVKSIINLSNETFGSFLATDANFF